MLPEGLSLFPALSRFNITIVHDVVSSIGLPSDRPATTNTLGRRKGGSNHRRWSRIGATIAQLFAAALAYAMTVFWLVGLQASWNKPRQLPKAPGAAFGFPRISTVTEAAITMG